MMSREKYADSLIAKGIDVPTAAKIAGVSEFWLQLRVDKSKIGMFKHIVKRKTG